MFNFAHSKKTSLWKNYFKNLVFEKDSLDLGQCMKSKAKKYEILHKKNRLLMSRFRVSGVVAFNSFQDALLKNFADETIELEWNLKG